jgi:hypothetical protein
MNKVSGSLFAKLAWQNVSPVLIAGVIVLIATFCMFGVAAAADILPNDGAIWFFFGAVFLGLFVVGLGAGVYWLISTVLLALRMATKQVLLLAGVLTALWDGWFFGIFDNMKFDSQDCFLLGIFAVGGFLGGYVHFRMASSDNLITAREKSNA